MAEQFDFHVIGRRDDTLVTVKPLTDGAVQWILENFSSEGHHPNWPEITVKLRHIDDVMDVMAEDGLSVLVIRQ